MNNPCPHIASTQRSTAWKQLPTLPQRFADCITLRSPYAIANPSVLLSSVCQYCNVRAVCSEGWTFLQYFCTI